MATHDAGPFMSATLTIDGIARPIEDTPQPSLPHGPARQTVTLDDHPEYAPWDFLSANVASYRPSCTCVAGEFMQLQATGAAATFLDGENPAQYLHVVLNNVHSLVHFQLLDAAQRDRRARARRLGAAGGRRGLCHAAAAAGQARLSNSAC